MVPENSIVVPLKQFEATQFGDSQVDRMIRNGHGILSYTHSSHLATIVQVVTANLRTIWHGRRIRLSSRRVRSLPRQ